LSPAEKAVTPDHDCADRIEMAAIIGAQLLGRTEQWWAAHGRAGIDSGNPDPLGMRAHVAEGIGKLDELDAEERCLIELAERGPAQAHAAAAELSAR
jgi:hypothetical protein